MNNRLARTTKVYLTNASFIVLLLLCTFWSMDAFAWTDELVEAARAVANGAATPYQEALVFKHNRDINNMALSGDRRMPKEVYQKVQAEFETRNQEFAKKAVEQAGETMDVQKRKPGQTSKPGTDSDYLTSSTTPEKTKAIQHNYEKAVDEWMQEAKVPRPKDKTWAQTLDTDLMGNAQKATDENFRKIGELQNDAYKRRGAAELERKIRDVNPDGTMKEPPTLGEHQEYTEEMKDFITKKSHASEKKLEQAVEMRQNPEAHQPGTEAHTARKNLEAEIHKTHAQQGKYLDRLHDTTTKLAEQHGVEAPSARSGLPAAAADRGPATRNEAHAVNALEDHLTQQAVKNRAEVLGEIGAKKPELRAQTQADVANLAKDLPPSQQGELINTLKQKHGDAFATEVAEQMRAKTPTDTPSPTKAGEVELPGKTPSPLAEGEAAIAKPKPGLGEQIMGGVGVGAQIGDAAVRQAGKAIDENRDLTAKDVGEAAWQATGIPGMYDTGYRISKEEQMKVARGEQNQLEAAANTAVGLGKAVVVDPIRDIAKQNLDEAAARAKAEGRQMEAADIAKTGAQIGAEVAGHFTGIKGLTEAAADADTFKERGDWAAQKAALDQYVVANTNLGEKKIRNIQNELEQLTHSKDVNEPAVRARVDELLAAHQAEQERMKKLADMAQRTLGEENPARIAATKEVIASLAKTKDMADYMNQIIKDRGEKLAQTPSGQSEKEGWGNGQVVDLPPEKSSGQKKDDSLRANGIEKQAKAALQTCDFRGAKSLIDQLDAGEGKATLESAYEAARSGEEQARAGIEEAKSLSKSGDYDGALAALRDAKATARCDKALAKIDQGLGIVQGKQKRKTVAATECWPNSEPYWDKSANAARCRCLDGYKWNSDRTACAPDRRTLVAKTDCSHIPHSAPAWDSEADRPGCFCQRGYEWDGEVCVNLAQREREQDEVNQRAAADFVGALSNLQNALSGRGGGDVQPGNERGQLQPSSPLSRPLLGGGGSEVARQCYRLFQQGNQTNDDETLAALYGQWQQLGCDSHMASFTSPQCASLFQQIEQTEDGDTLTALSSQWRQLGCENP